MENEKKGSKKKLTLKIILKRHYRRAYKYSRRFLRMLYKKRNSIFKVVALEYFLLTVVIWGVRVSGYD